MSPSRILLLISSALLLSACSALGQQKMGVALTAINYTEDDYDAVGIAMPDDIKTFEAMDRVSAYGGSGTMCCVALPEKWQPGMKLVVLTQAGTKAKTYKEWAYEKIPVIPHQVDVPRYTTPARVWIQIMSPDKVLVTVSNYSPENPNWPGEIKGGPKPSLEYRRKKWQRDFEILQGILTKLEKAVKNNPTEAKKYQATIDGVKAEISSMEAKKP
ncbi:hypothetical protein DBR44_07645 [Aquitalea sp. FJL05]|uniref:DUF3304 domain-containing protein n=1 Tax=Aquitalea sp. FJL05 TaxID=2153366 RepID=UPI000F594A9C|nr:DUF3304 domain-containing protein [Aquitalea sp. FJL05]RQO76006.1 hypothetical protein DBR44_07645 [Aquitalea sp. FJL05]